MGNATVQLPDGRTATVQYETPEQLDAAVSDLAGSSAPAEHSALDIASALGTGGNAFIANTLGIPGAFARNVAQTGKAIAALPYLLSGNAASAPSWITAKPPNIRGTPEDISGLMGKAGLRTTNPVPDSIVSQALFGIGQYAPNAMLGGLQTAGQFAANAGMNVAGGAAGDIAHRAFPNVPALPMLANMLVQGAPSAAEGIGKYAMRGGSIANTQDTINSNVSNFNAAGAGAPTVGQATEAQIPQAVENMIAKFPGGFGVMRGKALAQAGGISNEIDEVAGGLSTKSTPEQAGRAISKGITGEGGFVENFKAQQKQLYDALDEHIPQDKPISTAGTMSTLERLNATIPGAPAVSKFFQNPTLQGIEGAIKSDTQGPNVIMSRPDIPASFKEMFKALPPEGQKYWTQMVADGNLPYQALKQLRTLVGNELTDWNITSTVPKSKWSALYGGLTEDMKSAASAAGPDAVQAWNRANTYTRAGMDRISVLNDVAGAGSPEQVFQAAMSGTREGATRLRAVMQSVPPEAGKALAATVLQRMGRATPGQQNESGNAFSTETFLTNWNRLSPEAKQALFGRFGVDTSAINAVAGNLRSGSKILANPSGTGPYGAAAGMLGLAGSQILHNPVGAAAAFSPIPLSWLTAKAMTGPGAARSMLTPSSLSGARQMSVLGGLAGTPIPYVTQ